VREREDKASNSKPKFMLIAHRHNEIKHAF